MPDRRMLTKKVTDDDRFTELSASAQALYLHLSMCADDDGFCNQVSVSMFKAHASVQDLQALLERRYLYQFDTGVIVIKHWRMANALRKDRYTPTTFKEEFAKLRLKENGAYTMADDGCQMDATWVPDGCRRIDKDRIGEDRIDKDKKKKFSRKPFTAPTVTEVAEYCVERKNTIDPQYFVDYYTTRGWELKAGQKMKDWKACIRTWEQRDGGKNGRKTNGGISGKAEGKYNYGETI